MAENAPTTHAPLLSEIVAALAELDAPLAADRLTVVGAGDYESWFGVTDLAAASVGAAGLALAALRDEAAEIETPRVIVDRRLASYWFAKSLRPDGWTPPPDWSPISGDYCAKDGWIRIHANARRHRKAALRVLGGPRLAELEDRAAAEAAVAGWDAAELEAAIVAEGGAAARMATWEAWRASPPGGAVDAEPLIHWDRFAPVEPRPRATASTTDASGLSGVRVLDLTRVLAGPTATRFLAGYGAEVLRVDPASWEEPSLEPEMTLGKRCAELDLRAPNDRAVFEKLIGAADVLIHGYRPGALAGLGYDAAALRALNPRLLDVSLDAYGWSDDIAGSWAHRRGFDSLVQMSAGIAAHGMAMAGSAKPTPLPVQALDHATGYLMAAAALQALRAHRRSGAVASARLSLARTAHLLHRTRRETPYGGLPAPSDDDIAPLVEQTAWGPARRLRAPLTIDSLDARWRHPAGPIRRAPAAWG